MARSRGTQGPLESAQSHVGAGTRPGPTHDESSGQRNARAASEEARLRAWAFDHYDDPRSFKIPRRNFIWRGAEHEVYLDLARNRVIKLTRKSEAANYGFGISLNNDGQGATAGEYLDRLCLHNEIFNDDILLEGVLPMVGETRVITSQPFIDGDPAEPSQIDAYMAAKAFKRVGDGAYHHPGSGVMVHDLYPRNVVLTPQGKVRAIDPAILRVTPDFARDYALRNGETP